MCVSHVVLLCNKGQMNSNTFDSVKLTIDSLINAKQNVVSKPDVFIVLNQLSKVKDNTTSRCIFRLEDAIEQYKTDRQLNEH
mmetsp:Transcript_12081/g.18660  ORF Transcript_12081/g.18660 Transcript_12081/m.18660 type:complete len:82 (-) Transcript_12081:832-1077(-)